MKIKPIVFKAGDKVRIKNPEVFIRCGYPLTKEIIKQTEITDEEKNKIWDLLGVKYHVVKGCEDIFGLSSSAADGCINEYDKILDVLAYRKLRDKGFGGSERKIYTERKEIYQDLVCIVSSKRRVVTGNWQYGGRDWESGYYDANYLEKQKTHVILSLSANLGYLTEEFFEIEAKNVELVKE